MCKKTILIAILGLVSAALPGAETNIVDVIALGRLGTGTSSDGWQVNGVDNYAESTNKSALRINAEGEWVCSPVFAQCVTRVDLSVVSSSQVNRRLMLVPYTRGGVQSNLIYRCGYSASNRKFSDQTAVWPRESGVHAFKMELESGGETAWGVLKMSLELENPPQGMCLILR